MRYYFAPMEGINGYLYRRIHAHLFPGIDKYFMPFLVPHVKRSFNSKELKEIAPSWKGTPDSDSPRHSLSPAIFSRY